MPQAADESSKLEDSLCAAACVAAPPRRAGELWSSRFRIHVRRLPCSTSSAIMSKHAIAVDRSRPGPISLLTGQHQLIASRHGRGIRCKEDVRESSWHCILVNETLSQLQFHHDSGLQQTTAIWAKQLFDLRTGLSRGLIHIVGRLVGATTLAC